MFDLCNQFVVNALTGGLVTLVLYIMIFKRSFRAIGISRKRAEKDGNRGQEWLLWCLGSVLFANIMAHFGINYMTHLSMYLYILLVCISVVTLETRHPKIRAIDTSGKVEFIAEPGGVAACEPLMKFAPGTID